MQQMVIKPTECGETTKMEGVVDANSSRRDVCENATSNHHSTRYTCLIQNPQETVTQKMQKLELSWKLMDMGFSRERTTEAVYEKCFLDLYGYHRTYEEGHTKIVN